MTSSLPGGEGAGERPQVRFGTLAGHVAAPATGGVVCLLLAMAMSLASATVNLGGLPLGSVSLTGGALFGIRGWLAVVAFVVTVAVRLFPAAMPYRSIADAVAVAAWVAAAMQGMGSMFGGGPVPMRPGQPDFAAGARRTVQQPVSVSPGIGIVPFVAAGALALLGPWRARSRHVA